MNSYKNLSGKSGVSEYQIDNESITVRFGNGWHYLYTYASAGQDNIAEMKKLATRGEGLSAFIVQTPSVRNGYARKWR